MIKILVLIGAVVLFGFIAFAGLCFLIIEVEDKIEEAANRFVENHFWKVKKDD